MLPKVKSYQIQRKGNHFRDCPWTMLYVLSSYAIFDNFEKIRFEILLLLGVSALIEFVFS